MKHNAKTLEALKGSERKWWRIWRGKGIDWGIVNCPLCDLFNSDACSGCPIRAKTGEDCCYGTSYTEWGLHHEDAHGTYELPLKREPHCKECTRLAKEMHQFIKDLIPKGKV